LSVKSDRVRDLELQGEQRRDKINAHIKSPPVEYLGETLAADLLPALEAGRKLSSAAAHSRGLGYHGDGGNLWLQVTAGGRSWIFRYHAEGKQREMGLGGLAAVSLTEARGRAAICRRLVRNGVDPIERRKTFFTPPTRRIQFKEAAQRYCDSKATGWRSGKQTIQFTSIMGDFVYPIIGDWPVEDVDTDVVILVLEQNVLHANGRVVGQLWTTKFETAAKVRIGIERVLNWAAAHNMRRGENPARWLGHLHSLLPSRLEVKSTTHQLTLPYSKMNSLWLALSTRTNSSAEALRFAILTATRTREVTGARWNEIDFTAKIWTIPANRMIGQRIHRVALSDEAIKILRRMKPHETAQDDIIFPGAKDNTPLSKMAMAMALRKLGHAGLTTQGFRLTFRIWAAESTTYPSEVVEIALAQSLGRKAKTANPRGDALDQRRRLMSDWATHCLTEPPAHR
jgi:integrase